MWTIVIDISNISNLNNPNAEKLNEDKITFNFQQTSEKLHDVILLACTAKKLNIILLYFKKENWEM